MDTSKGDRVSEETEDISVVPNFRVKLKLAIEHRGVPRQELAQAAGVAPSAIGDMLTRKRRPYADQAIGLARVLRVPFEWLVDEAVAPSWPPAEMSTINPDDALVKVAEALGVTPRDALRAFADLIERESPGVKGNEKIEPVKRMKRPKAGNEVGAGRALGEDEDA